jgi:hypothetical protein
LTHGIQAAESEVGKGIEQCRNEHVPGDTTHGVEVNVHRFTSARCRRSASCGAIHFCTSREIAKTLSATKGTESADRAAWPMHILLIDERFWRSSSYETLT